jgi:3-oxoacyl-[acyl-carrier protein] reductase
LTAATDTREGLSTSNLRFDFTGRTVIVTGAGKGIGRSLAEAFAGAGADVVLVGRTGDVLEEAATAMGATPVIADVAKTEDAERVVAEAMARTGRIDVLVNNAGFLRDSVLWKMDDDAWNDVLDVHLGGTFRLIRACAPHFRAQKYGRIINMTSYSGLHGNLGQANYSAAKAGIIGLTKTAAKELGRSGVTVNAVLPFADTGMTASIPEDRKAALVASVPLGRVAAAEEMAAAVAFLASAEAGYVTGNVVNVDGGISM